MKLRLYRGQRQSRRMILHVGISECREIKSAARHCRRVTLRGGEDSEDDKGK